MQVLEEEEKSALNFDLYNNEQLLTVQRLKNQGFSSLQINALNNLINNDYGYEEIVKFFNNNMSAKEISEFANKLLEIKLKKQLSN